MMHFPEAGDGHVVASLLRAFPAGPSGGNPAGVVLLAGEAPAGWMQRAAAEIGAPTTGFVDMGSARGREVRARFFTPAQEIAACGHVTVAIATHLAELGYWKNGRSVVSAAGGRFPVLVETRPDGVRVEMQQRLRHYDVVHEENGVQAVLGAAGRAAELPVVVAGTGLRHLLVPVESVEALSALPLDPEAIAHSSRQHRVDTIGVFCVTRDSGDGLEVRMRDLCAGIGATEEPASGTTTCAVAFALEAAGRLFPARRRMTMLMGIEMGQPSRLEVILDFEGSAAVQARLRGRAIRRSSRPLRR